MIVIIPSNRTITLAYLTPLIEHGARFIIVDDTPGSIEIDHPQFEVYNWGHREQMLGPLDVGMPRKTGACMTFGFYIAWRDADDDEIIVTFGDDCEITDPDFPQQVVDALSDKSRPMMEGDSAFFNILDAYEGVDPDLYPRGFPYSQRLGYRPWRPGAEVGRTSAFNLGLWRGAFDVNAVDKINGPEWHHPDARLRHDSVMLPPGPLACVCSMNMQFRNALIPAVYQLPMHVPAMPHWIVDRYGDIWGGFILGRLMALKGDHMSVGAPMICHNKVPGYELNLWQEHIAHFVNDEFIALLDEASAEVQPSDYLSMMCALREEMNRRVAGCSPMLRPYMDHLMETMGAWNAALQQARP